MLVVTLLRKGKTVPKVVEEKSTETHCGETQSLGVVCARVCVCVEMVSNVLKRKRAIQ